MARKKQRDSGQIVLAGVFFFVLGSIIVIIPLVMSPSTMPMAPMVFEHEGYGGQPFKRHCPCAPPPYGIPYAGEPDASSPTNPRQISNNVFNQVISIPDESLSAFWWLAGQFLDHELTSTNSTGSLLVVNITGDPYFTTINQLEFNRAIGIIDEDGCKLPFNGHTPFIDASNVYGYNEALLAQLRDSEKKGHMRVSAGNKLPFKTLAKDDFLCGDHRCSEHAGLASMHTLWVREHNYWADRISSMRPSWTSDQVFWKARQIVIAEMQKIIYEEWLPAFLGERAYLLNTPPPHFDPNTSPDIHLEFAVAAYRMGHSMVNNEIETDEGTRTLIQLFINSLAYNSPTSEIGVLLKGFTKTRSEKVDDKIVSGLRNTLFGQNGIDLLTMNLVRGRDVGVARYGEILRCIMGKFGEETQSDLDPLVGMLQEEHVPGGHSGATIETILVEHFRRLRTADPNFYAWDSQKEAIGTLIYPSIESVTMKKVLLRNTGLTHTELNDNVFVIQ